MAETVATGNEYLNLLPITNLPHLRDESPESSPKSVPVNPAHKGAEPDVGSKGAV